MPSLIFVGGSGCDVNLTEEDSKHTPLHVASTFGNKEFVDFLLACGSCDVNARDKFGRTALYLAVEHDHVDIVKTLTLHESCRVDIADTKGYTPLHLAAADHFYVDAMRFFAEHHPQAVRGRDAEGRTLLHVAVEQGNVAIARFLVSEGFCRADEPDKQGCTPLDLALERGAESSVRLLQALSNVAM